MTAGWHQNFKVAPVIERTGPDGFVYDSKTEYQWWCRLNLREKAGEIRNLQRQVPFLLADESRDLKIMAGQAVAVYTADFAYEELANHAWHPCIDDVKGYRDESSKFRIRVFEAIYGRIVRIIRKQGRGKSMRWVIE